MLINCNRCNKEFHAFPSAIKKGKKYCSKFCYYNRNGGKTIVECAVCKKKITVIPSHPRKYCSLVCLRKAQKSKPAWNSNPIYRNCLVCGKKFRTILAKVKVGGGKYCSKECYLVEHSKTTRILICKKCKKEFKVQSYLQKERKYCSQKCRMANIYKRVERECLQCGEKFLARLFKVKQGKGKFCSQKCHWEWKSENLVGEKSPGWKGGITKLYKKIRQLGKYQDWKKTIKLRDKKCVLCGSGKNLEADHFPKSFFEIIIQYNIKTTEDAINCQEFWDINNGRTLCKLCHRDTINYGNKIRNRILSAKTKSFSS